MASVIGPDAYRAMSAPSGSPMAPRPRAYTGEFYGLDDPALARWLGEGGTLSGERVSTETALFCTAVFRSIDLIAGAIGMLPLHLYERRANGDSIKADTHPLFSLLYSEPNGWQTAQEFRTLMQLRALAHGNAYALKIMAGRRIVSLVPLDPERTKPRQLDNFEVVYDHTGADGQPRTFRNAEIFHLRGISTDGITGRSRITMARQAIGLALSAERATNRLYRNGTFSNSILESEKPLSDQAFTRLRDSFAEQYQGANNAGRPILLETGVKFKEAAANAKDAQHIETRKHQIEEVARVFGVPRPLLMMDETSWGSGIEALGQFFVTYALQPWFTAWEQAISRSLIAAPERKTYYAKFNANALLRGSIEAQGNFYAKALGAGGHRPWMTPNEIRRLSELNEHADGDALAPPTAPAPPNASGELERLGRMVETIAARLESAPAPQPSSDVAVLIERLTARMDALANAVAERRPTPAEAPQAPPADPVVVNLPTVHVDAHKQRPVVKRIVERDSEGRILAWIEEPQDNADCNSEQR